MLLNVRHIHSIHPGFTQGPVYIDRLGNLVDDNHFPLNLPYTATVDTDDIINFVTITPNQLDDLIAKFRSFPHTDYTKGVLDALTYIQQFQQRIDPLEDYFTLDPIDTPWVTFSDELNNDDS